MWGRGLCHNDVSFCSIHAGTSLLTLYILYICTFDTSWFLAFDFNILTFISFLYFPKSDKILAQKSDYMTDVTVVPSLPWINALICSEIQMVYQIK